MNIIQSGNQNTNKSSRRNYIPEMIVNHIVEGSAQSCINWFRSPDNKVSSAHFLVGKDGKAYQFVDIKDNAWANGLDDIGIRKSKSAIVQNHKVNPNWISVSIEYEGLHRQTQGALTDEQLATGIELHKYIIAEVKRIWGHEIKPNKDTVTGHSVIDPINKPNCPGAKFPFDKILEGLTMKDKLTWQEIIKKVASVPEQWENAITVAVNAAKAEGDLGALEIFKHLPTLIEKVYNDK
jgi:N-acetylmuramoyl-L-alanine amidase